MSMPLLAHSLLESLRLLCRGTALFAERCVAGITANEGRCEELVTRSHALATVLVPALGYATVSRLLAEAEAAGVPFADHLAATGICPAETAAELLSPKRMPRPSVLPVAASNSTASWVSVTSTKGTLPQA